MAEQQKTRQASLVRVDLLTAGNNRPGKVGLSEAASQAPAPTQVEVVALTDYRAEAAASMGKLVVAEKVEAWVPLSDIPALAGFALLSFRSGGMWGTEKASRPLQSSCGRNQRAGST